MDLDYQKIHHNFITRIVIFSVFLYKNLRRQEKVYENSVRSFLRKRISQDIELSLEELKKYVNDKETFIIDNENLKITVYGKRNETQKETKERIEKEEKYMENYKKFHENKNKL